MKKKQLKTIIFQTNYFTKILSSKISLFIIGYEVSLGKKSFNDKNKNIDLKKKENNEKLKLKYNA